MSEPVQLYFCRYCGTVSASGIAEDDREKHCRVCQVTAPHARLAIAAQLTVAPRVEDATNG